MTNPIIQAGRGNWFITLWWDSGIIRVGSLGLAWGIINRRLEFMFATRLEG